MKTRIIQNEPDEPANDSNRRDRRRAERIQQPARPGWAAGARATGRPRSSAGSRSSCRVRDRQRRSAKQDRPEGSRRSASPPRRTIVDAAVRLRQAWQGEIVLIQRTTKTVDDPAFRAAIADVDRRARRLEAGQEGAVAVRSRERRSDLARPSHGAGHVRAAHGTYDEAALYIDARRAGRRRRPERASRNRRRGVRRLDREGTRQGDHRRRIAKAGLIAVPVTIADPAARARLAARGSALPLLLGLTAVFATMGLVSLPSQLDPARHAVNEVIAADRARRRRRLLAVLPAARARRARAPAGARRAALEAAAATSGRAVLDLRPDGDDRDGRHAPHRRQDVHVVRDRHDDRRRASP